MAKPHQKLPGSVPHNNRKPIGRVDAHEPIDVIIKLRRKSEQGLPTLEQFVAGKRAFMSRHDLEDRYGASATDARAIEQWARANGLSVSSTSLGRRQVALTGSADAMSKAFGVELSHYKHERTGRTFRCPDTDVSVPADIAPIITGVFGLNDMPVAVRRRKQGMGRAAAATAHDDLKTQFPGSFYPNEVAKLYNFPPATGAGEKISVLEFGGGFDPKVLADYFKNTLELATVPTVNAIAVLGTTNQPGNDGVTGEVYLDIEVIGGMAPGATIDVYFAPWTGKGYLTAIEQAIHNDDYAAVSISYGLDEDAVGNAANPGWPMLNQNIDEAFREAAAVGIPVFVSSGDQGSSSQRGEVNTQWGEQEVTVFAPKAHAGYPATSPYATAVGGTLLYAANGKIDKEVVWNELGPLQNKQFYWGGATGGGVSDRYATVPSYQGAVAAVLKSANGGATGRGIPDVAGNAGASTGYLVSQPPASKIPVAPVGGTSAAAPMWAALAACLREAAGKSLGGAIPPFFFNDFVYAVGKSGAFNDITGGRTFAYGANGMEPGAFTPVGNNQSAKVEGYNAQAGFDLCTGWGTPNGVELANQLVQWLKAQPKPT